MPCSLASSQSSACALALAKIASNSLRGIFSLSGWTSIHLAKPPYLTPIRSPEQHFQVPTSTFSISNERLGLPAGDAFTLRTHVSPGYNLRFVQNLAASGDLSRTQGALG